MKLEDVESHQPLAEISIIPLVDVMLVLLILFMVTAPLLTLQSLKVAVPEVSTERLPSAQLPPAVVVIDGQGKVFLEDKPIELSELALQLSELVKKTPQTPVHLQADKSTQYQELAQVLAVIRQAGVIQLGLITLPEGK